MPGYFSFQKLITPRFVKLIYVVGLLAITASGIGLAIWAGLGLRSATLPTRTGIYYVAIGAGVAIVGILFGAYSAKFGSCSLISTVCLVPLRAKPGTQPLNRCQAKRLELSSDKMLLNADKTLVLSATRQVS